MILPEQRLAIDVDTGALNVAMAWHLDGHNLSTCHPRLRKWGDDVDGVRLRSGLSIGWVLTAQIEAELVAWTGHSEGPVRARITIEFTADDQRPKLACGLSHCAFVLAVSDAVSKAATLTVLAGLTATELKTPVVIGVHAPLYAESSASTLVDLALICAGRALSAATIATGLPVWTWLTRAPIQRSIVIELPAFNKQLAQTRRGTDYGTLIDRLVYTHTILALESFGAWVGRPPQEASVDLAALLNTLGAAAAFSRDTLGHFVAV